MAYWLLKEEPESLSFAALERKGAEQWDGVKNPLAQKHLRSMKAGDRAFFYETGKVRAVVGIVEITSNPYPDPGADDPRRVAVDVRPIEALPRPVTLAEIKSTPAFEGHPLVRMSRLSVAPFTAKEWRKVLSMARSG